MSEFDNINDFNSNNENDDNKYTEENDVNLTDSDQVSGDDIGLEQAEFAQHDQANTVDSETCGSQENSLNDEQNESNKINGHIPLNYSNIPNKTKNSGVKIFALVMAAVILSTFSLAGGYILGVSKSDNSKNFFTKTDLGLAEKPNIDEMKSAIEVYDAVNKSVVGITVYNQDGAGSVATGVIYTEDGYIITNDHIYSSVSAPKFKVKTYDGKIYDAFFVAGDARSDLAVIKIESNGFTPATFGDSQQIVVGESVVAIGRPTGIDENSMTKGIISLKERRVSVNTSYSMRVIQTDTPINPGNSGGALVNMYGQVIGITSSKVGGDQYEGIGFAIPTTVVKTVIESLIEHGYVNNRTRLGISYQEIDEITKEINDYPVTGVIVATVNQDSDLYGKIKEGDIITHVAGIEITSDDVILDAIESSKPGDTLEFTVYNTEGKVITVKAKLLADTGESSYKSQLVTE